MAAKVRQKHGRKTFARAAMNSLCTITNYKSLAALSLSCGNRQIQFSTVTEVRLC